jgi:trans-aconitate 2-methyltransferase
MATWDPDVYALYRRYRERPALDLLTAIPGDLKPREIWDLGCGLGEQAALLAAQMPVVDGLGWRASLAEIAASGPWAKRFSDIEGVRPAHDPADYYGWLAPSCSEIDIWTTTYLHALHGQDPIVDWTMGTSLRPYLDALPDNEKPAFLDAWRARLAHDYPRREDGVTLFPFKRLFILARKG